MDVVEGDVSLNQLMTAKEVFLCNSVLGIRPVGRIVKTPDRPASEYSEGQWTGQLKQAFKRVISMFLVKAVKRCLAIAVTLFVAAVIVGYFMLNNYLTQPLALKEEVTFTVGSGSNLTRVLNQLQRTGLLDSDSEALTGKVKTKALLVYAKLTDRAGIRAGEYQLKPGITPNGLLDKLASGDVLYHQITFPEGLTAKEWFTRLNDVPQLKKQLPTLGRNTQLPFIQGNIEGWLYPDSYRFQAGTSDLQLLERAHKAMQSALKKEWQNRAADLPYKTPYEALIMASIIEKETGVGYERAKICRCFCQASA